MAETKGKSNKQGLAITLAGPVITAITASVLAFLTSQYLSNRQAFEARIQLYTQLMSQREESDSALRKDMFKTIFESFLKGSTTSLDEQVLNLELLAYNFHESLELKPLFIYLYKKAMVSKDAARADLLRRLERVAREVSHKQLLVLEGVGQSSDLSVDLKTLKQHPWGMGLQPFPLVVQGIERVFNVYVLGADPNTHELNLRLEVRRSDRPEEITTTPSTGFWVSYYDFPTIDNTRLPHDQRVALVLNTFDAHSADMTLVYFPGTYASVKEKPYVQEVVDRLLRSQHTEAPVVSH